MSVASRTPLASGTEPRSMNKAVRPERLRTDLPRAPFFESTSPASTAEAPARARPFELGEGCATVCYSQPFGSSVAVIGLTPGSNPTLAPRPSRRCRARSPGWRVRAEGSAGASAETPGVPEGSVPPGAPCIASGPRRDILAAKEDTEMVRPDGSPLVQQPTDPASRLDPPEPDPATPKGVNDERPGALSHGGVSPLAASRRRHLSLWLSGSWVSRHPGLPGSTRRCSARSFRIRADSIPAHDIRAGQSFS